MTSFSTQNYRRYLKFLRCLSSVWIIALTGCGAKHYAQMPLAEQDSIRLQAKAAAAADAKRDVEVLASFGAGMGATFAAAMCGLMTGFIADATLGQGQDALFLRDGCNECRGDLQSAASISYPSTESAT
jgi:hypothetical protein